MKRKPTTSIWCVIGLAWRSEASYTLPDCKLIQPHEIYIYTHICIWYMYIHSIMMSFCKQSNQLITRTMSSVDCLTCLGYDVCEAWVRFAGHVWRGRRDMCWMHVEGISETRLQMVLTCRFCFVCLLVFLIPGGQKIGKTIPISFIHLRTFLTSFVQLIRS